MHRAAAVAALALALLAAPARAPALDPHQEAEVRSPWYLGVGLGAGDGAILQEGNRITFSQVVGRKPTRIALQLEAGWTLSSRVLFGFDLLFVGAAAEMQDPTLGRVRRALRIVDLDAVVTFFPWERGAFLRGGGGLSQLTQGVDAPDSRSRRQGHAGMNVLAGLGYAAWMGRTFNVCVNLDLSRQWYPGTRTPSASSVAVLYAGFDWY